MEADAGVPLSSLRVDGGMVVDELLMQFQADLLGVPVIRPRLTETTALGAAYAAGLATGFWRDTDELVHHWQVDKTWQPAMAATERQRLYHDWQRSGRAQLRLARKHHGVGRVQRSESLARLGESFDILVIGGGATGLGVAVDASARGYAPCSWSAQTSRRAQSSRSTKLATVGCATCSRATLAWYESLARARAPGAQRAHLVRPLTFLVQHTGPGNCPFMARDSSCTTAGRPTGVGRQSLRRTTAGTRTGAHARPAGLKGGVLYSDALFDDARLALALARTSHEQGAALLNYAEAVEFVKENGRLAAR